MKRLADQTLYEILEVPPDATPVAIAEAVERALALYGPGSLATYTLMSTEEATLLTRRIEEAQSTLLDPAARARYDAAIAAGPGEARAAASGTHGASGTNGTNGTNGTPPPGAWTVPPVIPALHAAPAAPRRPGADDEDEAAASPEPAAATPPVSEPEPEREPEPAPARPAPILLDREVAPPAAPEPAPPAAAPVAAPGSSPAPPVPTPPAPLPAAAPLVLDDTAWTGEVLRRLREARGITLQQISERTKVTRHHIENIEGDRYSALPASVYLRGILLSLARELRLDGQKVARSYLERVASGSPPPGAPKPR